MNICVTGALGHIGSKLIRNFNINQETGIVHLVDNFLTQRYASLINLPDKTNYCFHELDILSPDIEQIIQDSDVVIHLAAVTDAESSFEKKEFADTINRKGTEQIAGYCLKHQRKLIFFSTTSVYGSQSELVDENCSKTGLKPQSPYAESKFYGENFLTNLAKQHNFDFVILRLGTIFGYSIGMRFHTAVNKFIWQASTNQEITVWKTALGQKRPYCGLNDCISAINYVLNNNIFDRQVYNIVTVNHTVRNIVDRIKYFVPDAKIKFVDSPIMNQLSYEVSNKKSLQRGFNYIDNLETNIKDIISVLKQANCKVVKQNL